MIQDTRCNMQDARFKYFIYYFLMVILFSCKTPLKSEIRNPKSEIIREVYSKEVQYCKARVSNDLNTWYFFQHPEYKAIISMDKFSSARGYIQLDYLSITEQNPNPRVYAPPRQFHSILHDIKLEKSFIDKDERYAKFHTVHIVSIFFPFARGTPVRREFESVDYWEKVKGEWVVLNKVRPNPLAHISGGTTKNPVNLPEERAEYIEIPIKEIESVFEEKKGQK